jgi:hypothetical protein
LSNKFVEIIALTCSGFMGNAYERNQHEQLCVKLGFGRAWIEAVVALEPEAASQLNATECELQDFVLDVLRNAGVGLAPKFEALVSALGEAEAVAVLMVIGRCVTHALIVNTLALKPPVPSIFAESVE